MKRICLVLIIVLLLFSFSACTYTYSWEFNHSYEDIVEIKIIDLDGIGFFPTKDDFTVIKELDMSRAKELYEDITALQMQHGGPSPVDPNGNSFLIVFANGEFDIISIAGSTHCKFDDDGTLTTETSYLYSNKEAFSQLMDKYLNT